MKSRTSLPINPEAILLVKKNTDTEILHGERLSPDDLDIIREQIEVGFEDIEVIDPEIRGIVERNWPHLVSKLPLK